MEDGLQQAIERICANRLLYGNNEDAAKQGAILPILAKLGWDRDDVSQVIPEFAVGSGRVDYCLRLQEQSKVFVEAKRGREDLASHQEQLLNYAFNDGVKIAVLTNGLIWWLYLPMKENCSWEQRKFFTIDLENQDPPTAAAHFRQFLEFDAVRNGDAVKRAEEIHGNKAKQRVLEETLPKAWAELITEPDELLLDLLIEKVEAICGSKPDPETATRFLKSLGADAKPNGGAGKSDQRPSLKNTLDSPVRRPRDYDTTGTARPFDGDFTGLHARSFTFKGVKHQVRNFAEILSGLCGEIYNDHPQDFFNRVTNIPGRRTKQHFSRQPNELFQPAKVGKSDIFVETCKNANGTIAFCRKLLELFEYPDVSFEPEVS